MKKLIIAIGLFIPTLGFAQNDTNPVDSEQLSELEFQGQMTYYIEELKTVRSESASRKDSIQQLTTQVIELQEEVAKLQKNLLNVAVNYIFIPYDAFSVTQIALPSFKKSKDLPIFKEDPQYMIVLDLVQNYETDSKTVTQLLRDARTAIKDRAKAQKVYNDLINSPLYKRYTQFNDWEQTYLGKIIKIVANNLHNPTSQSDKIIAEVGSKHFAIMEDIKVPDTPAPQPQAPTVVQPTDGNNSPSPAVSTPGTGTNSGDEDPDPNNTPGNGQGTSGGPV